IFQALMLVGVIVIQARLASAQTTVERSGWLRLRPATTQSPNVGAPAREKTLGAEPEAEQPAIQATTQGGLLEGLERQKKAIARSRLLPITVPDNSPPLDHFKGLAVFTEDGSYISPAQGDVTPSPSPAGTSQYGSWTHLGGRQFAL